MQKTKKKTHNQYLINKIANNINQYFDLNIILNMKNTNYILKKHERLYFLRSTNKKRD